MTETKTAGSQSESQVWDLPVRLFHWALAGLIVSQVVTVTIGGNAMQYHVRGGYCILTLVLFRIVWGFVGSRHARFADFIRGPRSVLRYTRSLARGDLERHVGHNPLGGWSVALMLGSLLVQAGSGLFADDDIMTSGPLAKHVSDSTVSVLTRIHDINALVLLTLIVVHVAAVVFYLLARRENLIVPMITGRKMMAPPERTLTDGGSAWAAALILIASGLAVAGLVNL